MYPESECDALLLEDDFRRLVRDALPAAEEIMRIQVKPKTPEPVPEPEPVKPVPTQVIKPEPESYIEEKPISNGNIPQPDLAIILEENRKLKDENAEMTAEIRSSGSKIARIQDDLDSKNRELKRLSRQLDQLEGCG